jgi:uncharacterized protein
MKFNDVIVKKSKIEGKGVFANRDFKKGEVVMKWDTSIILTKKEVSNLPESEKRYVNSSQDKYFLQQSPVRFVNHSCDPNTKVVDGSFDIAIKEIKKGDEITSNYPSLLASNGVTKCNCGSNNCKKIIKRQASKI